jgi:hypothetical protein
MCTDLLRCGRSKLQCQGYVAPQPRIFEPHKHYDTSNKKFVTAKTPKAKALSRGPSRSPSKSPAPALQFERMTLSVRNQLALGKNDQDVFDYYLREAAAMCSVHTQSHFFTVLVPKVSIMDVAARNLMLCSAINHRAIAYPETATPENKARLLDLYNAAIRAITRGQPSTESVLVASVLFALVEYFYGLGEETTAIAHLDAADRIIREHKERHNQRSSPLQESITNHIEPVVQTLRMLVDEPEDMPTAPTHLSHFDRDTSEAKVSYLLENMAAILDTCHRPSQIQTMEDVIMRLHRQAFKGARDFSALAARGDTPPLGGRLGLVWHAASVALIRELKVQHKVAGVSIDHDLATTYTYVVDLAERFFAAAESRTSEDVGGAWKALSTIGPLFVAAVRSPDETLRRRALALLRSMGERERGLSPYLMADLAEALSRGNARDALGLDLRGLRCERLLGRLRLVSNDSNQPFDQTVFIDASELHSLDMVYPLNEAA